MDHQHLSRQLSKLAIASLLVAGCTTGGENGTGNTGGTPPAGNTVKGLQGELLGLVKAGKNDEAFDKAFETGDKLFDTEFTAAQGGGAKVDNNERYTRMPRADRSGPGEWNTHTPKRATGPNAQACGSCHNQPNNDGAGSIAGNVHRDPLGNHDPAQMIQRNTPHLFGTGALQLLAEEMSADLENLRQESFKEACRTGQPSERKLLSKGVDYGVLKTTCSNGYPTYDESGIVGIDGDLVVRPYQWKKSTIFIRDFQRGAAHNEIGMQAVELVGEGKDGDGDGVVNELDIGQITSLAVYMAGQPRPTTRTELSDLGVIPALSADDKAAIRRGEEQFGKIGCAGCHMPELTLNNTVFREPSPYPNYRDMVFATGENPVKLGVDPAYPVSFDISKDLPDNRLKINGADVLLGSFTEKDAQGKTIVRLYGDMKRHDLGPDIAEAIDEPGNGDMTMIQYGGGAKGVGASVFGTKELWGLGCTGPWLHDGRATTLREAILFHGGEAIPARDAFKQTSAEQQKDLFAFLYNQVIYVRPADGPDTGLGKDCTPRD